MHIYMRCTGMHVICLCYPCTLLYSSCMQQGERASERADRTWTNGRTNQPTWTNQRTKPGTKRTNESVTHTSTAQHSTAQPYEATAVPLPLHMKQKNSHLSERHVSVSRPIPSYAFRLPLTPTLVGREEERRRRYVRLCASTV